MGLLRAALWLVLLCATACTGDKATRDEANTLVVFAASSLRQAFVALAEELKRDQPGVQVSFSFAGSQELRMQLEHGATADVFASADMRHMQRLSEQHRVDTPITFARNEPVLVIATEASQEIQTFAHWSRAKRVVVGANDVPIGAYTNQILERATAVYGDDFRARIEAHVVSRELNVKQVLAKVMLGEADSAVVYRSDVTPAPREVRVLSIPPEINVTAEYPIAVLSNADHPKLAQRWVALLQSTKGQAILHDAGFRPVPTPPTPL